MKALSSLFALSFVLACGPAQPAGPQTPGPGPMIAQPDQPAPSKAGDEASAKSGPINQVAMSRVKELWRGLAGSTESCGDFDYFPRGGMKAFACHLDLGTTYSWLSTVSGIDVFVEGPHSKRQLDLDQRKSFGHYNPKFVRWLVDHLVPGASDPVFRAETQETYDKYVKPLAQTFLVTYEKIQAEPDCFAREVARIETFLAGRGVPPGDYERYFYFMNDGFCDNPDGGFDHFSNNGFDGGANGNVVKTCVAFWIRRTIDGTAPLFHEGLTKLVAAYEEPMP